MKQKVLFLCTDKKDDCLKCCLNDKTESCGHICEKMAKKMGVAFSYAILIKEPDVEYIGC